MLDTLIVGSGISGLLAGAILQQNGQKIQILDKEKEAGGRMATLISLTDGLAKADHGAQFFTVRESAFQHWVDKWLESGVATEWCRGFSGQDGYPRYRGTSGMQGIPQSLAEGLPIKQNREVTQIRAKGEGWHVQTNSTEVFQAQQLLLTPPVPQSLALLQINGVKIDESVAKELSAVQYDPCFAVMVQLNSPSLISMPGGIQVRGPMIDWIGDNQKKGISEAYFVTIHASAPFTRAHLHDEFERVGKMLINVAQSATYFSEEQVVEFTVHLWPYAQPIACYPERCCATKVNRLPLVFAGDGFKHARVEGAALSGIAAAEMLL